VDFITEKQVENNGEIPQYNVVDSHPAISNQDIWKLVQLVMEEKWK